MPGELNAYLSIQAAKLTSLPASREEERAVLTQPMPRFQLVKGVQPLNWRDLSCQLASGQSQPRCPAVASVDIRPVSASQPPARESTAKRRVVSRCLSLHSSPAGFWLQYLYNPSQPRICSILQAVS